MIIIFWLRFYCLGPKFMLGLESPFSIEINENETWMLWLQLKDWEFWLFLTFLLCCQKSLFDLLIWYYVKWMTEISEANTCPYCVITTSTIVGAWNKIWFLDALKCSISEFIWLEMTWEVIKTVFFKIWVTKYISELLNLGAEILVPSSIVRYENLCKLPPESTIYCLWNWLK